VLRPRLREDGFLAASSATFDVANRRTVRDVDRATDRLFGEMSLFSADLRF
jgi:hypothetical protein